MRTSEGLTWLSNAQYRGKQPHIRYPERTSRMPLFIELKAERKGTY